MLYFGYELYLLLFYVIVISFIHNLNQSYMYVLYNDYCCYYICSSPYLYTFFSRKMKENRASLH
jgi:hypothetical protein